MLSFDLPGPQAFAVPVFVAGGGHGTAHRLHDGVVRGDAREAKKEGEIASSVGQTLYWDYYCYVKEHPVDRWEAPTRILYGELDNLSERALVEDFAARFGWSAPFERGKSKNR